MQQELKSCTTRNLCFRSIKDGRLCTRAYRKLHFNVVSELTDCFFVVLRFGWKLVESPLYLPCGLWLGFLLLEVTVLTILCLSKMHLRRFSYWRWSTLHHIGITLNPLIACRCDVLLKSYSLMLILSRDLFVTVFNPELQLCDEYSDSGIDILGMISFLSYFLLCSSWQWLQIHCDEIRTFLILSNMWCATPSCWKRILVTDGTRGITKIGDCHRTQPHRRHTRNIEDRRLS